VRDLASGTEISTQLKDGSVASIVR